MVKAGSIPVCCLSDSCYSFSVVWTGWTVYGRYLSFANPDADKTDVLVEVELKALFFHPKNLCFCPLSDSVKGSAWEGRS